MPADSKAGRRRLLRLEVAIQHPDLVETDKGSVAKPGVIAPKSAARSNGGRRRSRASWSIIPRAAKGDWRGLIDGDVEPVEVGIAGVLPRQGLSDPLEPRVALARRALVQHLLRDDHQGTGSLNWKLRRLPPMPPAAFTSLGRRSFWNSFAAW